MTIAVLDVHLVECVGVVVETAACTKYQYPRTQIRVSLGRVNPAGLLGHEYAPSLPHGFSEQGSQYAIEYRGMGLFGASRSWSHPPNREGDRR